MDDITLIGYLEHWSKLRKSEIAIIDDMGEVSYKELGEMVKGLQEYFLSSQIISGDNVMISCPKNRYLVAMYIALFGIGVSVAPFHLEWSLDNFKKMVDKIKPKAVILHKDTRLILKGYKKKVIYNDTHLDLGIGMIYYNDLLSSINKDEDIFFKMKSLTIRESIVGSCYDLSNKNQVYLNVTSGSTGDPLIVAVGEYEIVQNAISVNKYFMLSKDDRYCCMFPSDMHPHEIFARPLVAGCTIVLLSSKHIRDFQHYIKKYNVTQLLATPSVYSTILKLGVNSTYWTAMKYVISAGESAPLRLRLCFYENIGIKLNLAWGSSETTGIAFYVPEELLLEKGDILGVPLEGYKSKIDNTNSELLVAGDSCLKSYYNDKCIQPLTSDGYYKTSDVVEMREDGIYIYKGRLGDIIKIGGRKVSTNSVKIELESISKIEEILVMESENELHEKNLGIFVKTHEYKKEVLNLMYEKLENLLCGTIKFKIIFINEFPRLSSGKINRQFLKDNY